MEVERRVFKEKPFIRFSLVVLTMGCLAHFINDGYLRILSPISPLIMEEYMLNYTQIGLLNTVLNVSAALLQILTGFLTFHFRRRSLIIWGLVWSSTLTFLIAVASEYLQLLIILVLVGVGLSSYHPPGVSLISNAFERKNVGKALSIHLFAGKVGMFSSVFLAGLISAFWNWRFAFFLWAAGGIIVALIFSRTIKDQGEYNQDNYGTSIKDSKPVLSWPIISLTIAYSVYTMSARGLSVFIPIYLVDINVTSLQAGMIVGLLLFFGAVGTLIGGFLADRFDKKQVIFSMITLIILPISFITIMKLNILFLTIIACLGVSIYAIAPATQALITDITEQSERAWIFGILFTISVGFGAITPTIMGGIADALGLQASFYFLTTIVGIGMISILTLKLTAN